MKNTLLLDALHRRPTPRRPIWLMRQAGRYLPEYRQLREKAGSFMDLCRTPDYACEATLQPLARYQLDAAILFSDILTIPDAFGLGLHFEADHGPKFETALDDANKIEAIEPAGLNDKLQYVFQAIRLIKSNLRDEIPLLGFSGSPWTLATYMVEGGGSRSFSTIKRMLYAEPLLLQSLLEKTSRAVIDYLDEQIHAGVDAVQLFDTWGGILTQNAYQEFSFRWTKVVVDELKARHPDSPIIFFCKGAMQWSEIIKTLAVDCLSVDWTIPLSRVRYLTDDRFALQGNLDPQALLGTTQALVDEVDAILSDFGNGPGLIFNLGHGLTPDIPPDMVKILVERVKNHPITQ